MGIPALQNVTGIFNVASSLPDYVTRFLTRSNTRSILQIVWDFRCGYEPYLESPVFPIILSVVFYFVTCLPFTLLDIVCPKQAWYRKYKIQVDKEVTKDQIFDALSLTFWNHILLVLPRAVAQWIWCPVMPLPEEAPSLFEFCWHQMAGLFLFDLQYFCWHVAHHKIRFLYKHIHAVHHHFSSPFAWVTQYLHPLELAAFGFLITANTWVFNCHPLTAWSYMLVSIIVSVEAHIGFDFPFLLHNLDPTGNFGGPTKHDMHHLKPHTNYQPFFNHWDRLFGTYCPPVKGCAVRNKTLQDNKRHTRQSKKVN
ncbi:cholesterol 25-hydroxylase-like protein 1, member 2 [Biomphalaria glabrata]|uniref:Cholesterol 25-hydroxylase-like protein 1, member 2 n=1 Tax=Biomphalaria glabrata TaxID=6526 RepID=A0A9W2ZH93_BIOGL|nr:cholesterol 25-hydroxylase-like protein 1, member 2 [Biomphalaria glabrata]